MRRLLVGTVAALALLAASCSTLDSAGDAATETTAASAPAEEETTTTAPSPEGTSTEPETAAVDDAPDTTVVEAGSAALTGELTFEVLETVPHDIDAFTQGLELTPDGSLLEGTGLTGASDRRLVDPATGAVTRIVEIDAPLFGEGITVVDDRVVQLSWQSGVAIEARLDDLSETRRFSYDGEGWGLCWDGARFVMSDGSDELTFRDREFTETGRVSVTLDGEPIDRINELECVAGRVWANVWQSDVILGIDPTDGDVEATLDAASLKPDEVDGLDDVLNGIAHRASDDTYWLTGKRWPVMHRVRILPGGDGADQ